MSDRRYAERFGICREFVSRSWAGFVVCEGEEFALCSKVKRGFSAGQTVRSGERSVPLNPHTFVASEPFGPCNPSFLEDESTLIVPLKSRFEYPDSQ